MKLDVIKTEKDFSEALERLEKIFDAKRDTPDGDELELLSLLIDQYEKIHFPIDAPDRLEASKFRMEQLSMRNDF